MSHNEQGKQRLSRRAVGISASALLVSGCFGSFGATNLLYDWNAGVSSNKWVRWLVFLVLVIVPVYSLFIVADALVLNTIEFFTGKNPVGRRSIGNGRGLRTSRTHDPNLVKHELERDGRVERTFYVKRVGADELLLLDEQLRELGRARAFEDGSVEVFDGEGRSISKITPEAAARAEAALLAGASPSHAVATAVDVTTRNALLATSG